MIVEKRKHLRLALYAVVRFLVNIKCAGIARFIMSCYKKVFGEYIEYKIVGGE